MLNATRTIESIEADLAAAKRDQRFCVTPTVKRTATIAVNRFMAERQNALDAMVARNLARFEAESRGPIAPVIEADPTAAKIAALEAEIAALKAPVAPVAAPVETKTVTITLDEATLPALDVDALLDDLDGDFAPIGEKGDGTILPTQRQMDAINRLADALDYDGIDGFGDNVSRGEASAAIKSLKAEIARLAA